MNDHDIVKEHCPDYRKGGHCAEFSCMGQHCWYVNAPRNVYKCEKFRHQLERLKEKGVKQ